MTLVVTLASPANATARDDLTPQKPTYPTVTHLANIGENRAALDKLNNVVSTGSARPIEALVLRAVLLGAVGRSADAEAVWQQLINRETWMRTFSRRALVTSMTGRGRPGLAEPILEKLSRSDQVRHLDLFLLVADAHRDRGDLGPATAAYREVLRHQRHGVLADSARLGLALVQENAGNLPAAIALLRDAQLEHRTGAGYLDARKSEQRLNRRLGQSRASFAPAQYLTVIRRLRNHSHYTEAAALIDEWRTAQPDAGEVLDFELIRVLYEGRSNPEAAALCTAFTNRYPASQLTPRVKLTEFRLAIRMGNTATARTLGQDLWKGHVQGATPDQRFSAAELLAAYLVAVGNVEEGLGLYRSLFKRATTADGQRMMLWKAGVAALRAGQNERALTNLRALNRRRPTGDLLPAGQYWQAVAEARAGQTSAASRLFRTLVETRPYHYYGLQARTRLIELKGDDYTVPESTTHRFPALALEATTQAQPEFKAARVLARAGLLRDAAWYLRRLPEHLNRDRGLALLAARTSAAAGDHAATLRLLATHFTDFLQQPGDGLPDDFYELVYPRPFTDIIIGAASARGLKPAFMFSLMRQESRFDPAARSMVGALGLFQIMPYTAAKLGPRANLDQLSAIDFDNETTLLQPAVNTAIAATLASDLFVLFGGALAPVVASYNAGEERVGIWWESALGLREDLFVDSIPYSETRRFVREVLANVAGYQRVYGEVATIPQFESEP